MRRLGGVLVVDGSRVVRELLLRLMRPYANHIEVTSDCEAACEWLATNPSPSLVIADLEAPGGGGRRLLEFVAGQPGRRPRVLLTGRHVSEEERTACEALGAIACLGKPLRFRDIARAVRASEGPHWDVAPPRLYAEPPARAHLLDDAGKDSHIVWDVHDLSVNGALLDTRGPVLVGTQLFIALAIGDLRIPVRCEVIRIQEPGWDALPGVGVRFEPLEPEDRAHFESWIRARLSPRPV